LDKDVLLIDDEELAGARQDRAAKGVAYRWRHLQQRNGTGR